jgi:hypothetical protein
VGDGTTSVVIVAAELLKRANDLVKNKIHPTSIIAGSAARRSMEQPLCFPAQISGTRFVHHLFDKAFQLKALWCITNAA